MKTTNVREARENLSSLLDAVATGEEFTILRHGKPVARLLGPKAECIQFPDRTELRSTLPRATDRAVNVVRSLRDEERH